MNHESIVIKELFTDLNRGLKYCHPTPTWTMDRRYSIGTPPCALRAASSCLTVYPPGCCISI